MNKLTQLIGAMTIGAASLLPNAGYSKDPTTDKAQTVQDSRLESVVQKMDSAKKGHIHMHGDEWVKLLIEAKLFRSLRDNYKNQVIEAESRGEPTYQARFMFERYSQATDAAKWLLKNVEVRYCPPGRCPR